MSCFHGFASQGWGEKAVVLHKELKLKPWTICDVPVSKTQGKSERFRCQDSQDPRRIGDCRSGGERIYWAKGDQLAVAIGQHMHDCEAITKMEWAGSYRRGRETIVTLIYWWLPRTVVMMDHFEAFPQRSMTILRGDTKVSIRGGGAFQVDLRLAEESEFGARFNTTGSQAHNVHVRRLAKQLKLKVNEYGVFRIEDEIRVAGATEVYQSIICCGSLQNYVRTDRNFKITNRVG